MRVLLLLLLLVAVSVHAIPPTAPVVVDLDGMRYDFTPLSGVPITSTGSDHDIPGLAHGFQLTGKFFVDQTKCPPGDSNGLLTSICATSRTDVTAGKKVLVLSDVDDVETWHPTSEGVQLRYQHRQSGLVNYSTVIDFICDLDEDRAKLKFAALDTSRNKDMLEHRLQFDTKFACGMTTPGNGDGQCAWTDPNKQLEVVCPADETITDVLFADFGAVSGTCSTSTDAGGLSSDGTCTNAAGVLAAAKKCIGQHACQLTAAESALGLTPSTPPSADCLANRKLFLKVKCAPNPLQVCQQQRDGYVFVDTPDSSSTASLSAIITPVHPYNFDAHTVCLRARLTDDSGNQVLLRTEHCALTYDGSSTFSYVCLLGNTAVQKTTLKWPVGILNEWISICATRDPLSGVQLFINSETFGQSTNQMAGATVNLALDQNYVLGENLKKGSLDEIRVFARVLSNAEIRIISVNAWHGNQALFEDPALLAYFPCSSYDLRNIVQTSSVLNPRTTGNGVVKGMADLFCSADRPCSYDKDRNSVVDPPQLLVAPSARGSAFESGFQGKSVFNVRVRAHKRYFYNPLLQQPWQATIGDQTGQPVCSHNWTAADAAQAHWSMKPFPDPTDFCFVMLEYTTSNYAEFTSQCRLDVSQPGSAALAGATSEQQAVAGEVRLDLKEPIPLSCQQWEYGLAARPDCRPLQQTLRSLLFRLKFITYFQTRATKTNEQPVVVYDQASAISVVVDQSVVAATLMLDQPKPYFSALKMTAMFRTFVNWPYTLSHTFAAQSLEPLSPTWQVLQTPIVGRDISGCDATPVPNGRQICVQDWNITIIPASTFIGAGKDMLSNLDTRATVRFTVHSVNGVANDYQLRDIVMTLSSGELTPATTEKIDLQVSLTSCKQPMVSPSYACAPGSGPSDSFTHSAVAEGQGFAPIQTAYFAVVPTTTKANIEWCQLLQVSAYPQGQPNSNLRFMAYSRKANGKAFGMLTDPLHPPAARDTDVWVSFPAAMNGDHKDWTDGCTFELPVMHQYFSTPVGFARNWTIEAMIFVKYVGVKVVPQPAAHVTTPRVLSGGRVVHVQAVADTSAMNAGAMASAQSLNLMVAAPVEAKLDTTTPTNNNPTNNNPTNNNPTNNNPTNTPAQTNNYITYRAADGRSSEEVAAIAVGVGIGAALLGALFAMGVMWHRSKQAPALGTRMAQMEKHLGATSSSAAVDTAAPVPQASAL